MKERPLKELLGEAEALIESRRHWSDRAADTIKALRTTAGLSQRQLAAESASNGTPVSQPYIAQIESGTKSVSPETFETLTATISCYVAGGGQGGNSGTEVSGQVEGSFTGQGAAHAAQARGKGQERPDGVPRARHEREHGKRPRSGR